MSESKQSPEALHTLLDLSSDGGCLVDPAGWRAVYANRALETWLDGAGLDRSATSVLDWFSAADVPPARAALEAAMAAGETACFEARIAGPLGHEFPVEVRACRVDHRRRTVLALWIRRLPTALPRTQTPERTDPLTGLPDRTSFRRELARRLAGQRRSDHRCAVLFIDVDGFKRVNDEHGHLAGDQVLVEVARRLAECVRTDDLLARYGGDEFVVLLARTSGPEDTAPVVARIRKAFDRPIASPRGHVTLTVSVGAAEMGPENRSVDALIHAADQAMYAAKRAPS